MEGMLLLRSIVPGMLTAFLGTSIIMQTQITQTQTIQTQTIQTQTIQTQTIQAQNSTSPEATPSETEADAPLPAFPASCEALPLVGGGGSEVTKTASPPSVRVPLPGPVSPNLRSNWNTDWYIPNPTAYRSYLVYLMPHSEMEYSIEMFLKYPDETNQKFYDEQNVSLIRNELISVEVTPDRDLPPYQINTNIGGLLSIGARYTVSIAGCR